MAARAGHDGKLRPAGLAGDLQQLLALLAREEEGLGVGAEDHEAGEPGLGEVRVVLPLVVWEQRVCLRVEEGDGGGPDPAGRYLGKRHGCDEEDGGAND